MDPRPSCRKPYREIRILSLVAPPELRWTFVLALLPEEIEALKARKRVTKSYPKPLPYGPPPLLPEDWEALRAGKTVTKTLARPPPPDTNPDLNVKVVEYRQQGNDHTYAFEAI